MSWGSDTFGTFTFGSVSAQATYPAIIWYQTPGAGARPMNLGSLITEAQRLTGRVESALDDRTKKFINQALEEWSTSNPWEGLKQEEDFTADGTRDMYLPTHVGKINWIVDVTSKCPVERREQWDRRASAAMIDAAPGTPFQWRELGKSAVSRQPAAATQVYFDPEDSETVVCHVQGLAADASATSPAVSLYQASEYVTCVTGAETASSRSFVKVLSVGKSTLTSGDVLMRFSSGGDTVSRIHRNAYRSEYRHISLMYAPTDGNTLRVNYNLRVPELADNNQIVPPGVDPDFLIYKAAEKLHMAAGEHEAARDKRQVAQGMLERQSHSEQAFGEQDHSGMPDPAYWNHEDI